MRKLLIVGALTLATLAACTSATAPTSHDCNGGTTSGSGQC
jgi:hypothetical protein